MQVLFRLVVVLVLMVAAPLTALAQDAGQVQAMELMRCGTFRTVRATGFASSDATAKCGRLGRSSYATFI